jgi:hypothetical protein
MLVDVCDGEPRTFVPVRENAGSAKARVLVDVCDGASRAFVPVR